MNAALRATATEHGYMLLPDSLPSNKPILMLAICKPFMAGRINAKKCARRYYISSPAYLRSPALQPSVRNATELRMTENAERVSELD